MKSDLKLLPKALVEVAALAALGLLIGSLIGCTPETPTQPVGVKAPVALTVTGDSMLPTLRHGDRITVLPCDPATLQPGDVIVYQHEGRKIVHRVREVRGGKVWTKGDNNARRDNFWVYPHEVVGIVRL